MRVRLLIVEPYVNLKSVVWSVVLVVVVDWKLVRNFFAKTNSRLVSPTTSDVLDSVATTAKHEHGDVEFLSMLEAAPMALDREVKGAESIPGERVRATLHNDRFRLETIHHFIRNLSAQAMRLPF